MHGSLIAPRHQVAWPSVTSARARSRRPSPSSGGSSADSPTACHLDMQAMSESVRTSTANIAAALGGSPTLDPLRPRLDHAAGSRQPCRSSSTSTPPPRRPAERLGTWRPCVRRGGSSTIRDARACTERSELSSRQPPGGTRHRQAAPRGPSTAVVTASVLRGRRARTARGCDHQAPLMRTPKGEGVSRRHHAVSVLWHGLSCR